MHDLILDEIIIKNFLSIGAVPQRVTLSSVPLTLILGQNLDIDAEESRNGVGKTTIIQAICYAFFGKPLTSIKIGNLINDINQKDLLVILKFRCKGVSYRIERGQKPNLLHFFVGEKQVTVETEQRQTDEAAGENKQTRISIERVIGMSRLMFEHIVALNTYTIPFLRMRPGEQRPIIEELFGITALSEMAAALKDTLDDNKAALRDEEVRIKTVTEANARIQRLIAAAQDDASVWTDDHQIILQRLAQQVACFEAIDFEAELVVFDQIDAWQGEKQRHDEQRMQIIHAISRLDGELRNLDADLARAEADVTAPSNGETIRAQAQQVRAGLERERQTTERHIVSITAQAQRKREAATAHRQTVTRLETELAALLGQLDNPDAHHCVTCGQGLAGTDHLATVIARLSAQCEKVAAEIDKTRAEAENCEREATTLDQEAIASDTAYQAHKARLLDDAHAMERMAEEADQQVAAKQNTARQQITILQAELDTLRNERAGLQMKHDALPALPEPPRSHWASRDALWQQRQQRDKVLAQWEAEQAKVNPILEKVTALGATLVTIDYTRLNDIDSQVKHEQFLHKLLTSKDSFIRKRIIDQQLGWLNRMLNAYVVELRLPHEVKFMPDLTVEIALAGRDRDFEQFSRGEMNRVALATSWAFRDLWENMNGSINLLCCDEVLDQGTDGAGVEAAVAILTRMAQERRKNVFLISHREALKTRIDRVLIAQKLDNFTTFYEA
jgi:DNA repair exonuclease SbcCD ATPase subunit